MKSAKTLFNSIGYALVALNNFLPSNEEKLSEKDAYYLNTAAKKLNRVSNDLSDLFSTDERRYIFNSLAEASYDDKIEFLFFKSDIFDNEVHCAGNATNALVINACLGMLDKLLEDESTAMTTYITVLKKLTQYASSDS